MSCPRAATIDVESFLIDAGAAEFESFRAHFVECADCAAAVEHWTVFDFALRGGLSSESDSVLAHPETDRLEAYLSSPREIGDQAIRIENHLDVCPSCRTELDVLRTYERGFLASGVGKEPRNNRSSLGVAANRILERLGGFVSVFSFEERSWGAAVSALAMVLLVVVGLWWSEFSRSPGSFSPASESARMTRSPASRLSNPSSPEPFGSDSGKEIDGLEGHSTDESFRIAERREPNPEWSAAEESADRSDETPSAQVADAAVPEELGIIPDSHARPPSQASIPSRVTAGAGKDASRSEEILLAALSEMPLPSYAAPIGSEPLGWMRQFGAVRFRPPSARVEALAPSDHIGLSLSSSPRLWWDLSRDVEFSVQVTIVDDRSIDPVLRVNLAGPHEKGLHLFDVANYGLELDTDVDYRWFVSLIVDPNRPSRNPVSAGALRVIPDSDWRREMAGQTPRVERGHTMARLGIWYDAYDFFASLSVAHPEVTPIARDRDRMVELVARRPKG